MNLIYEERNRKKVECMINSNMYTVTTIKNNDVFYIKVDGYGYHINIERKRDDLISDLDSLISDLMKADNISSINSYYLDSMLYIQSMFLLNIYDDENTEYLATHVHNIFINKLTLQKIINNFNKGEW